ncbi:hypothetical protein QBC38DRAFT_450764 [Podospora fimiseda]|uniref:Uncharacterized protein n=1 Tax=Podospora fimiseda TaxID=252190 RepID=A0AAN7BYI6_9PEZI|nr:hypothetical protein QBC38DRAFT_450764 [Podospora fimiseda]
MGATSTSLLAWTPWVDVFTLIAIVLCATASAIVVSVSHDKEVDTWKIKPAVWLAIFSAMSNIAFSSALATGIAVRFWLKASEGTTLSQLHYIWDHGRGLGFLPAVKAGSEARRVTLISVIAYLLQFSGGPLLQRSINQRTEPKVMQVPMYFDIANRIPDGWFGSWTARGTVFQHRRSIALTSQWFRNDTIPVPNTEGYSCPGGSCSGLVRGAGLAYNCSTSNSTFDMSSRNLNATPTVFYIQAKMFQTSPSLNLTTSWISGLEGDCQATITTTMCNITAAVVEYPITIANSTAVLRLNDLKSMNIISANDNTTSASFATGDKPIEPGVRPEGSGVGPMAGLMDFVTDWVQSNSTARWTTTVSRWLYSGPGPGPLGDVFFKAEPWDSTTNHSLTTCGLIWDDPTDYVISSMHEYMFRVAHRVGEGLERQSFVAERSGNVMVFKTDKRFLGTAMGVAFTALLLVSSLSWGWWRLGRTVGLSPLETGLKLFGGGDRGLNQGLGSDATIDKILEGLKDVEVKVPAGGSSEPGEKVAGKSVSRVQVQEVMTPGGHQMMGSNGEGMHGYGVGAGAQGHAYGYGYEGGSPGMVRVDTDMSYGIRVGDLSARTTAQGSMNSQEGLRI